MTSTQTEKLVKEYTTLAASYDRRWSTYLDASLHMTMEVLDELPAGRVLDVACGTGLLLEMLANHTDQPKLVGVDRVPAMLDVARQRIGSRATLLECKATGLPFDDASFPLVICTNALHYFPGAVAALQEMRRVLTPSGKLVVTDWCRDYLWMRMLNRVLPLTSHAHAHTFNATEIERCLALADFKIAGITRKKIDWFWGLMTIHATPV